MRIGLIGLGTIGAAVVDGIAGDGHRILVSRRNRGNSDRLAAAFDGVDATDNAEIVARSDLLILGLRAEAAPGILASLPFRTGQRVISLMADADAVTVAALVAPATLSARMIPFPAIARGGSPILCFGDRAPVDGLFGARNEVFAVGSEAELDAYVCAQAVLSPAVRLVGDAAGWLAARGADAPIAERFLRMLVATSLTETSCADLLRALDTPGGYNRRLREHMIARGMTQDLRDGLDRLAEPS